MRVRANGETLLEQAVTPGAESTFDAPAPGGWVRASRLLPEAEAAKRARGCEPNGPDQHLRLRPAGGGPHLADLPARR